MSILFDYLFIPAEKITVKTSKSIFAGAVKLKGAAFYQITD